MIYERTLSPTTQSGETLLQWVHNRGSLLCLHVDAKLESGGILLVAEPILGILRSRFASCLGDIPCRKKQTKILDTPGVILGAHVHIASPARRPDVT
jgi:hypothetical protein